MPHRFVRTPILRPLLAFILSAGLAGSALAVTPDEVVARWGHDKKAWRTRLAALGGRANVAVRNYPLSAPELKKKLKLTDGGDLYLFACTLHGGDKAILECKRI